MGISVLSSKKIFSSIFAVAVGAVVLAALPIAAPQARAQQQSGEQHTEVFKDWLLRCGTDQSNTEHCALFQDLIDETKQQPLMQLAVGIWGADERQGIIITLPLGVILPPGIEIEIDGATLGRAPFYRCASNGCQVRIPLEQELLAKLKAGSSGRVIFRDISGRDIPIAFSLSGFTAGYAKVR